MFKRTAAVAMAVFALGGGAAATGALAAESEADRGPRARMAAPCGLDYWYNSSNSRWLWTINNCSGAGYLRLIIYEGVIGGECFWIPAGVTMSGSSRYKPDYLSWCGT